MKRFKNILLMTKKILIDPAGAAVDFMTPGAGYGGPLTVYFIYCAGYALFLYIKPANFPADFSEAALEFSGKPYAWIFAVQAFLDLAFNCVFCALFAAFAAFLRDGRLAFRFLTGCAACGAYAAAAFYFKSEPLFALPFLVAAVAAAYAGVRAKKTATAAFFRFSLAVSAAMLLCLPASSLAVALHNEALFTAVEYAGGIWMLVLTIKAAKAVFGVSTARVTLALLFSMIAAVSTFYILKNLGIIPSSFFRFIMFM